MKGALVPLVRGLGRPYLRYTTSSGSHWLLPARHDLRRAAVTMYQPYSTAGLVRKYAMRRGLLADRVEISSAWLDRLERIMHDHLGETSTQLAFYVSSPGALSKVAALGLDHDAQPVAFLKIATSDAAHEALEREFRTLQRLQGAPSLNGFVPVPWHWIPRTDAGSVLITSPAPPRRGPRRFGAYHRDFLHVLRASSFATVTLDETAEWRRAQQHEGVLEGAATRAAWHRRITEAMTTLAHTVGDRVVETSRIHGDFAPWNTRLSRRHLFVFDWEASDDRYFTNHDSYHFRFMTTLLLRGRVTSADLRLWQRHAPSCKVPQAAHMLAFIVDLSLRYHRLHREEGRLDDDHILRATGMLLDGADEWMTV